MRLKKAAMIGFFVLIIGVFTMTIIENIEKVGIIKEVSCYDKYGNEIIDLVCKNEYMLNEVLMIIPFMLGALAIVGAIAWSMD